MIVVNGGMFGSTLLDQMGSVLQDLVMALKKLRDSTSHNDPLLKRYLRSLPVIKIPFGSTNFIDKFTASHCHNFVLTQIVNFLLLK